MFDTIKSIVGDIASGAVKDQRIALSHEQLSALDLKLKEALAQNALLAQRTRELEAQLKKYQRAERKGDRCPYCNEESGKLDQIKPHRQSLMDQMGTKIGLYKCANPDCGKEYESRSV
jgi:uncharacterized protein with PIN domain